MRTIFRPFVTSLFVMGRETKKAIKNNSTDFPVLKLTDKSNNIVSIEYSPIFNIWVMKTGNKEAIRFNPTESDLVKFLADFDVATIDRAIKHFNSTIKK